ncbi:spindle assembly checkpoint component Mad1 [Amylocarpus encephaloides]|uniref:Spindle assembly checkpoint component MAD1 n=1 Tax=Amylocarpus encephaloides TaxID=45428 RepID=A0A9P8C2J3_9HELO|nr:spindle assembly checkpoint component Mad1 [Amylocarpus encephaloides]
MQSHSPRQSTEAARRRSSIGAGHRASLGSSIPRVQSRIALARAANHNQPTFDFLTGEPTNARPPTRDTSLRKSTSRAPTADWGKENTESDQEREKRRRELDELKAEIKTLKYTIDNHKQEEELSKLRHESELRDARRKAEEDFKLRQAAEAEKSKAARQYESLLKETTEIKDAAANEKAALERRLREVEEGKRVLEEDVEDVRSEREESIRAVERKSKELQTRNDTLQQTVDGLLQDSDRRESLLQEAQHRLSEKDKTCGNLEAEVLRLKAQNGDTDTLAIIKRELSEQVTYIRSLEASNRGQAAELKHFKRLHKSVEVAEEEKRSLQRRLDMMEGLENGLGEAKIQRQRLEDERLAWTAYLQSQAGPDGKLEFDSPEALARALVEERVHTATAIERLGILEAESSEKDVNIQTLETEKSDLSARIARLQQSGGNAAVESKALLRVERQRALAVKEAEFLRAQLRNYDAEEDTFTPENVDETKLKRIQELEDTVDRYRQEVQKLHAEISTQEKPALVEHAGTKRPRDDSGDTENIGQLLRKNRRLQDDLSSLQRSTKLMQKELSVTQERLTVATQQSKTRILSLRSNPTSDVEAVKMSTLKTLRQENADCLAQLEGSQPSTVPSSALDAARLSIQEVQSELASVIKRNDRLKKVWGAKSLEFRQLVISLLGWDVVFMKDGKTRVTSHFYPSKGDDENSILFDGERGTMKISGGPQSAFAVKIGDQIKFWVKERGSIPCLLAALTLEFYEEANRDGTPRVDG